MQWTAALVLQHHRLLPIKCHFDDCKAQLVRFPCKTLYIRIPGFSFSHLIQGGPKNGPIPPVYDDVGRQMFSSLSGVRQVFQTHFKRWHIQILFAWVQRKHTTLKILIDFSMTFNYCTQFCIAWQRHLTCTVWETSEDTLVCVGLRRIVTVAFFAPCTNILTYLLTISSKFMISVDFEHMHIKKNSTCLISKVI